MKRWLPFLRAVVAAALLGYLFSQVSLQQVLRTLSGARLAFVGAAALSTVFAQLAAAARLRLVASHYGFAPTLGEMFRLTLAAAFYGLTVPGGNLAGGAVRIYRLGGRERTVPALAAVLADRLHATFGMAVVGFGFWIADAAGRPRGIGLALLAATLAFPLLYILARLRPAALTSRSERWRRALGRETALPVRASLPIVGYTLVAQAFGIMGTVLAAAALTLPVPIAALGWIRSVVGLAVIIPVSVSGLGVREGVLVALLSRYAIMPGDALAFSLLVYATTVLVAGALGGVIEGGEALREAYRRRAGTSQDL